jgi:preprotein translocase subunit SecD
VKLKYDADRVAEVEELALRQAIETIRGRVDKFGVAEPTIIKKGTDIIVELPGAKAADFERIKSIIGRTAQLEFKIVDDGSEYMKKVAAAVPKDGASTVRPSRGPRSTRARSTRTSTCARREGRDELTKFIAGLAGDLAVPNDREIGLRADESARGQREWNAGQVLPDLLLLKKRAGVTGEYLSNADESWDEMGRPEVSFTMNRQGAAT